MRTKIERKNKSMLRKLRIRHKIKDTGSRPRLCVYRSNKYIYGQIVDNTSGETIVSISSKYVKYDGNDKKGKIGISFETGKLLAQKAKEKNIDKVVFDRGKFKYHGRVKALAEGARKGGLKF